VWLSIPGQSGSSDKKAFSGALGGSLSGTTRDITYFAKQVDVTSICGHQLVNRNVKRSNKRTFSLRASPGCQTCGHKRYSTVDSAGPQSSAKKVLKATKQATETVVGGQYFSE